MADAIRSTSFNLSVRSVSFRYFSSISEAIGALGYRTIRARDGREAVLALLEESPAVMLVDMIIPEMTDSAFLGLVKRSTKWSRIPRVIITGTNDPMIGIREDAPVLF